MRGRDPLRSSVLAGPGYYARAADPSNTSVFGPHKRAPAVNFGVAPARHEVVGPNGERPADAGLYDVTLEEEQLVLSPTVVRRKVPAYSFGKVDTGRGALRRAGCQCAP
jgi:hypothetical protein